MPHDTCYMEILGVRIDNLEKKEILEKIESFLTGNNFHQIATVNPEFILEAQKNEEFKKILGKCDLNVADGFGIKMAFLRSGRFLRCRFAGADLLHEILSIAERKNQGVFLIVNKHGLSSLEEIKESLIKLYPKLRIEGSISDPNITEHNLQISDFSVLFCNFGAPNQEIFLNSIKNDSMRIAMGVGGSFDFVTGKIKRAPVLLQKTGLEWFWRLLMQPKRIKRIFNAVVVFPIRVIFSKNA